MNITQNRYEALPDSDKNDTTESNSDNDELSKCHDKHFITASKSRK